MLRKLTLPLGALLLSACPAYEGPIDVILVDMDDTAVIEWAEAGSDAFEKCTNSVTSSEATVGCGPYGVGEPGDYTVRVTWQGVEVEQDVTLERDGDYQANVALTFEAAEFVE
jgi:hypothetical protein